MTQIACPECGNPLQGNETSCAECGMSLSPNMINTQFRCDEGDNEAEDILRKVINSIKILLTLFSIIEGAVLIFAGVLMLPKGPLGIVPIIGGILSIILGIFMARLVWAIGMIFVNISTNVRNIKQILKTN